MHFNFTSCYLSSITLKASDALSPKFPLCSPPSPGWSQLLLGQEQQVTGQGEPIEEFKMWAILPQSALLSFFPCQLLVFTQPCRNLIFARLLPHTEFDTWQWVQTFTRWRKVDCSVFYRQILHKQISGFENGKGPCTYVSAAGIRFCALLCLLIVNACSTSRGVRWKSRGRGSPVSLPNQTGHGDGISSSYQLWTSCAQLPSAVLVAVHDLLIHSRTVSQFFCQHFSLLIIYAGNKAAGCLWNRREKATLFPIVTSLLPRLPGNTHKLCVMKSFLEQETTAVVVSP